MSGSGSNQTPRTRETYKAPESITPLDLGLFFFFNILRQKINLFYLTIACYKHDSLGNI